MITYLEVFEHLVFSQHCHQIVELLKWKFRELHRDIPCIVHDLLEKCLRLQGHCVRRGSLSALVHLVAAEVQAQLDRGEDALRRAESIGQMDEGMEDTSHISGFLESRLVA
jgi:hypothetical protein